MSTDKYVFLTLTFIGVRVLHLYQEQFAAINYAINEKIDNGDWVFVEPPMAFTWDPESAQFYNSLNIKTQVRETYYTSIHYLVKPNNQNSICCEIQVRTLFEEVWGEIDHTINYPHPTESIACKEQIRVLAKLVSTGTRLADSIFRSNADHKQKKLETHKCFSQILQSRILNNYSFRLIWNSTLIKSLYNQCRRK